MEYKFGDGNKGVNNTFPSECHHSIGNDDIGLGVMK